MHTPSRREMQMHGRCESIAFKEAHYTPPPLTLAERRFCALSVVGWNRTREEEDLLALSDLDLSRVYIAELEEEYLSQDEPYA